MVVFLIAFAFEIIGQMLFEIFVAIGIDVFSHIEFPQRKIQAEKPSTTRSFVGYLFIGVLFGMLSVITVPERIIRLHPVPGLSIIAVPALVGLGMKKWGDYRRHRDKHTLLLQTFWGGAILAFGTVLFRFVFLTFWAA